MNCEVGSVWRKWDFHIHTPYSILNNNYGFYPFDLSEDELEREFDQFVKELFTRALDNDIAAIGITDYFLISGYKRIVLNYLQNDQKMEQLFPNPNVRERVKQIYVFPNIELRLEEFVGKGAHAVNYHVIFSNTVSIQEIEDNFLGVLSFASSASQQRPLTIPNIEYLGKQIKRDNGAEGSDILVGLKHVSVSYRAVLDALEKNDGFSGKYLICIPVDEDLSQVSWRGRDYNTRKVLYQQCHCLMTASTNTIRWAIAENCEEERIREFGSIKPCIWGSDAHGYERMFHPDQEKYCWIKADPTYEGLKQVLYEPSERVKIQTEVPDLKDGHQIINSVTFEDDRFQSEPIVFSDNLTCIIGGKSTGKSLLLEELARAIDPQYVTKQNEGSIFRRRSFDVAKATVLWKDGTTEGRKIVYVPQTFLNRTIDNPEKTTAINKIIENVLLQEPAIATAREELISTIQRIKKQVSANISEYCLNISKIKKQQDLLKEIGSPEVYSSVILQLEDERKELAASISIEQSELDRFAELETLLSEQDILKKSIEEELRKLQDMCKPIVAIPGWFSCNDGYQITHNYSESFPTISEQLGNAVAELEQLLSAEWDMKKPQLIELLTVKLADIISQSEKILEEYSSLKVKVDKSEQLRKISERLAQEKKKKQNSEQEKKEELRLIKRREELREAILSSQSQFLSAYNSYRAKIIAVGTAKQTDLKFDADIIWKQKEFQGGLGNVYDNRNYSSFRSIHKYDLADLQEADYSRDLLNIIWEATLEPTLLGGLSTKGGNTIESALSFLFKDWYNIHYRVTSGNDSIETMSPGKKALVLLEMLISLEDSKCPILIDQPEDDLDNRSIYDDLVQYLRKKKHERQIIVVTHNANVVLGADAEEIIIANQDAKNAENYSKRFEYRSGAIENDQVVYGPNNMVKKGVLYASGIQTQVCDILEGGRPAFELRQNKYSTLSRGCE